MIIKTTQQHKLINQPVDCETLSGLEPISALSASHLVDLAQKTFVELVKSDTVLVSAGESDHKLLYLLDGQIKIEFDSNRQGHVLTAGMPESWYPIANTQPRQATVIALTDVEIIRVEIDQLDHLLTWDQIAQDRYQNDSNQNKSTNNCSAWYAKLRDSHVLHNLPAANIEALFMRMQPISVKMGDVIIRQGECGDYYYLIQQGAATVSRKSDVETHPIELAVLCEGMSFGEEALISDQERNASVTMASDGILMRLSKRDFNELLKEPLLTKIGFDAAMVEVEKGAIFIDVRVASEYAHGHLPRSINLPLGELRNRAHELDVKLDYICYCNTSRRSSAAAFVLTQYKIKCSVLDNGLQDVPHSFLISVNP